MMGFLAGATTNQSGWDGWVEFRIPEGEQTLHRSLWELSTQGDAEGKFYKDYEAALSKPLPDGWFHSGAVYVAATFRKKFTLRKKQEIARDLAAKYGRPWGWVVVLDVDDFVQWIEKSPAVETWAARELGLGNGRFGKSLEYSWRDWANETKPGVSEALVTAGRDLTPLCRALRFDTSSEAAVQVDSAAEAVALVYCAIRSLAEEDANALMANALVVADARAAEELAAETVPPDSAPVTVLLPHAARKCELLVRAGHRVIRALGHSGQRTSIMTFERARRDEFQKALSETMRVEPSQAELQARACGCSVSVWQIRNLHIRGASHGALPVWATSPQANAAVSAILLGGWNESSQSDREIIQSLTGQTPADFFASVQGFGTCDDPLLEVVGAERFVIAPAAAFAFIAPYITGAHLERLRIACSETFKTVTPEVSSRWEGKASEIRMRNPNEEFSDFILDGLAETLLRIAVLDEDLRNSGALSEYTSGQAYVNRLVRELPGLKNDPRVMASLDQRLPVLAEAAPLPFVEALESLLQGDVAQLRLWLGDEQGIFAPSFHTGLLWALELLAWSSDHIGEATALLARLAELDPGGRISNRPQNSLREIFLPWHPQTNASLDLRESVLGEICRRTPQIGWRLLIQVLPGVHQSAVPTCRPSWRDFGRSSTHPLTVGDVREAYQRYIDLSLELTDGDLPRLSDLVAHYPQLSPEHRTRLDSLLSAAATTTESEIGRHSIWQALHDLVVRHKGFADADWAMPPAAIEHLESLAKAFQANDLLERHRWLFDNQLPETGHPEADHAGWEADVEHRRKQAIAEILREVGWDGIKRLVESSRFPYVVGDIVARESASNRELFEALDAWRKDGTPSGTYAVQAASGVRFVTHGEAWTRELLAGASERHWSPRDVAYALFGYPDSMSTFGLVADLSKDVDSEYWRNRYPYLRLDAGEDATFLFAVERFLENDRAADLIDMNRPRLQKLGYSAATRVLDMLIEQLSRERGPTHRGTFNYDIQQLFTWLRKQPEADATEVARREYALLPLLTNYGREPETLSLHTLMSADPSFFIDVLCDLFRPASGERESNGRSSEQVRGRAHAAFELLHHWKEPPGLSDRGVVDEDALNAWVDGSRSIAAQRDRADVADKRIGEILFHLPIDPTDGAWPHTALRRLLERISSRHLEDGLITGAIASRGVTWRGALDGGTQERDLEAIWRTYGAALGERWPRARRVCNTIADSWLHEAEAQDREAKKRRSMESR